MSRPTVDYVRAGDVIRVGVYIDAAVFGYSSEFSTFRNSLSFGTNLRFVAMDSSGLSFINNDGVLVVDVQTLGDFAHLNDVVGLVAGRAQQAGLKVLISGTRGEFVSQVEQTGGVPVATLPAPGTIPSSGSNPIAPLGDFFGGLLSSPTTLAAIVLGVVVLVIAAKK